MTLRLTVVVLFLLVSITAASEDTITPDSTFSTHNIGAGIGFITGYGLSYRHWFKSGIGVQVNLAPIFQNKTDDIRQQVSVGLSGLNLFKYGSIANLYGYAGVHGHYYYREYIDDETVQKEIEESTVVFVGTGPGIDIHIRRLSFNFMCGITGRFSDSGEYGVQMSGDIAIYYSF